MTRYLNSLNIGMLICDECEQEDGKLLKISGIKDELRLNRENKTSFTFIADYNFIEFEIPDKEDIVSFRFFIRTLGGTPAYVIPFIMAEMGLSEEVDGVMTQRMPMIMEVENFEFPRKGKFAIEVYKHFGKIDKRLEDKNVEHYRKKENFVNAISFEVI